MCYGTWLLGSIQRASLLSADLESSLWGCPGYMPFGFVSCGFAEVEGFRRFATQHLALAFLLSWRAPGVCGVLFLHAIPAGLCSCMGWVLQGIWEHPRMPPVAPHLCCCTCSTWSGWCCIGNPTSVPYDFGVVCGSGCVGCSR